MIALGQPRLIRLPPQLAHDQDTEEQNQAPYCYNAKLKNELCRNYLQMGYCKYQERCQFAHGVQELRQHQSTNYKYKTKKCLSFHEKGCCTYGERCNFLHHGESDEKEPMEWSSVRRSYRQVFSNAKGASSLF